MTSPIISPVRLTIPAREALLAAGNDVGSLPPSGATYPLYTVTLLRPPPGLVVVECGEPHGPYGARHHLLGLRLASEPEFPYESPAAWYDRGALVPCPECGAALVWAEAAFVPGWRLCLGGGHACRLSGDGRQAIRQTDMDASTQHVLHWRAGA